MAGDGVHVPAQAIGVVGVLGAEILPGGSHDVSVGMREHRRMGLQPLGWRDGYLPSPPRPASNANTTSCALSLAASFIMALAAWVLTVDWLT